MKKQRVGRIVPVAAVVILAVLAGLLFIGPNQSEAEEGVWAGRAKIRGLVFKRLNQMIALREQLNLTSDQKSRFRSLFLAHRQEIADMVEEMATLRQALKNEVLSDVPDETAIRRAASDLGESLGENAVRASRLLAEAKAVLTPEQLALLKEHRASRQEGFNEVLTLLREGEM